jgi:hypothetical protein
VGDRMSVRVRTACGVVLPMWIVMLRLALADRVDRYPLPNTEITGDFSEHKSYTIANMDCLCSYCVWLPLISGSIAHHTSKNQKKHTRR